MNSTHFGFALCRHTKTNGHRCHSPALTTSAFCYFHQKLRRTRRTTLGTGPGLSTTILHPLHNAGSIQQAISMVVHGLATGQLHPKQANPMLQAIQTAMANLD